MATGTLIEPVAPAIVPEAGDGTFAPVTAYLIEVTVGSVDGAPVLLLGTISVPLKLTLTFPLVQPAFRVGFVVMLVLGWTPPRIGMMTELKLFVPPLLVILSPLIAVKMLTSPLQVLSALAPQLRALSLPMM